MRLFAKSAYSLSPSLYGGARKRLFIGLMVASCLTLCLGLFAFLVLPWVAPGLSRHMVPAASVVVGLAAIAVISWLCLTLVFHIYTGRSLPGFASVRNLVIRLFLPLMELIGPVFGVERNKVRRSFIKVNNELVMADRGKVDARRILLLLPHCVQRSTCAHRLTHAPDNCVRCGQCPMSALLALRDRFGFMLAIATGGTIARKIVVEARPALIIAIACERDLTSGIQDSHPLPVFGILNERPCGPCHDTLVPLDLLEKALEYFIHGKSPIF